MPRLQGVYEEACAAATNLVFIPDQPVLTLKSIAIIPGFNQGLDLAKFYESLYLSRLSDWKSHTFDAAFINRKLDWLWQHMEYSSDKEIIVWKPQYLPLSDSQGLSHLLNIFYFWKFFHRNDNL